MPTFNYELPGGPPEDPWERLSAEACSALGRIGAVPAKARELLPEPAAAPVASPEQDTTAALDWARAELSEGGSNSPLSIWGKYDEYGALDQETPTDFEHLLRISPNLADIITRLHTARNTLRLSGVTTPDGELLSDTMKPVLIPWRTIQKKLPLFSTWVNEIREVKDMTVAATGKYGIRTEVNNLVTKKFGCYRKGSALVPAAEYVDERRVIDGLWGMGLMQTGTAGLQSIKDSGDTCPETVTGGGNKRLCIYGEYVDEMGIMEWLSLSLQEITPSPACWLPANRMLVDGHLTKALTPYVTTYRAIRLLGLTDTVNVLPVQPRLAIVQ